MKSYTFLILALLALLSSTAAARTGNSRYHSAKCLAVRRKCGKYLERESGACRAGKYARNQSRECHERACAWCSLPGKGSRFPCTPRHVKFICKAVAKGRRVKPWDPSNRRPDSSRPKPTKPPTRPSPPRPSFSTSSGSSGSASKKECVFKGGRTVVVDLSKQKPAEGWESTTEKGLKGLIYKKDKKSGIEPHSPRTTMCFKMKVSQSGDYLATAVSSAPHGTEHNDMWISSSMGFKLIRHGKVMGSGNPGQMLKAYQNNGGNKIATNIYTVDHNAHAFVVSGMTPSKTLSYCMSGRSSKYKVFKLALVKCESEDCKGSGIPNTGSLVSAKGSPCE